MHTDRTSSLIVEQTVRDGMNPPEHPSARAAHRLIPLRRDALSGWPAGLAQPVAQTRSAPAGAVV
jgi:hypothetical protein